VLEAVRANPGVHLRELERLTALPFGTLRHHVAALERRGEVRSEQDLRFRRYYVTGLAPSQRAAALAMRSRPLRRILAHLLDHAPARHRDLVAALGIPPSSLSTYLRRLVQLGLLRDVGAEGFAPTDLAPLRAALASVQPTPLDRLVDAALGLFEQTERRP